MGDVPFAADGRASLRLLKLPAAREALLCTGLAAIAASLLVWLAPPGGDLAAHEYQRYLFLGHGFTLWNNFWYAGRYAFVGYSVLYYPLAALLGIHLLSVLTVALAAAAFALVLEREWGRVGRWPGRSFAVLWAGMVITGELPFALGAALALLALLALRAGWRWTTAVLMLLVLAASPVALILLAVVLAGVLAVRRPPPGRYRVPAIALAVAAGTELVLLRLFPSGGSLSLPAGEAAAAATFCIYGIALVWRVERARVLRAVFSVYLAAVALSFAIPTGLAENVQRLRFLALPLALLIAALRRWRPLPIVLVAVLLAGIWNVSPLAAGWTSSAADLSSRPKIWTAPVAYLHAHLRPAYRVEAVDTSQHWPAFYLAAANIPLVRGWFRQDDYPFDGLLYRRRFTASQYVAWLRRLGVAYVVLTNAPPDYTSRREAWLVRSGRTGLAQVFRARHVSVYAVPHPRPIVTGPGRPTVVALRQSRVVIRVSRPGTYHVAIRWSPYWQASTGCLDRTAHGMLKLRTRAAATVRIAFDIDARTLFHAFADTTPRCGPGAGYPASRTSSERGFRFALADHSSALRLSGSRGRAG
jgi:hypothetical protein